MARGGVVVQGERLRDQVYRLIREDLKAGRMTPGQRVVETELAERYNVSRTPVREALFQLSRDGLLTPASDRGYNVPVDTIQSAAQRHEVRRLLDPRVAYHAAEEATLEECKALAKAFEKQRSAHEAGKVSAFITANHNFRAMLRDMCGNEVLARCSALVDDLAQITRVAIFQKAEFREVQLRHDKILVDAIARGDAAAAELAVHQYINEVNPLRVE